jgi:hypothetical protein
LPSHIGSSKNLELYLYSTRRAHGRSAAVTSKFSNFNLAFSLILNIVYAAGSSYLFPMAAPGFPPFVRTDLQRTTRQRLLDLICSFASAGVPNTDHLAGGVWRPVDAKAGVLG